MTKLSYAIAILFVLPMACENKECCDSPKILSLNSYNLNGKVVGFSFAEKQIISYPNSKNQKIDFTISAQTNDSGKIVGAFLCNTELTRSFYLANSDSSLDSAKIYFDFYKMNKDTIFTTFANYIKPGQVWIIRTNNNLFGKILIYETIAKEINKTLYAEVTFQWDQLN